MVLPKFANPERIRGNMDIFDFTLSEEMTEMYAFDTGAISHDLEVERISEMLLNAYVIKAE